MANPFEEYYSSKRQFIKADAATLDAMIISVVKLGPISAKSVNMYAEDRSYIKKDVQIRLQVLLERGVLKLGKNLKLEIK